MDRRKFILSSAMGVGALTVLPKTTLASTTNSVSSSMETFLDTKNVSITILPKEFLKTHQELMILLDQSGYVYNATELKKLNSTCYILPIQKTSLLGFKNNELAIITKEKNKSKFYILEEQISTELAKLSESYAENMKSHGIESNTSDFAFPVEGLAESKGRKGSFSFKNKLNNTITLKKHKNKTRTIIN